MSGQPLLPLRRPAVSATHLLWQAAGSPTNTTGKDGVVDSYACREPCWWCGHPAPGWARARSVLPSTFPFPLEAAVPESPHLCLPCGWALCDRIALPQAMAVERIRSKAQQGRRQQVAVRGEPPARWLTLELADGTVGLWTCGPNTRVEEPWQAAREALREVPEDVDPCAFVEAVPYDDLDAGPVEKFRSFHHFATRDRWWPCTDSDRMEIRAWLLDPPAAPWVAVIGEGKRHHAIEAQRFDAVTVSEGLCVVWYRGAVVVYEPAELAALVDAIEGLTLAGARDEEIGTGEYRPRADLAWLVAWRQHEPVVEAARGGAVLDLALYLRRNRKELGC